MGMRFPRDFDGAHHVNNEQERLDKWTNKVITSRLNVMSANKILITSNFQ